MGEFRIFPVERFRAAVHSIQSMRNEGKNESDIFGLFKESVKSFIQQDRLAARDIIIKVLQEETDEGKTLDPSSGDRDINVWRWCWASFLEMGLFYDADSVVEECYLHLLRLQKNWILV